MRAIGVTRAYATRHGEGPLPTEDTIERPERHNGSDGWQGAFRTGALDVVLLRSAMRVAGGIDGLAVTCLDRVEGDVALCGRYVMGGAELCELELTGSPELTIVVRRAQCPLSTVPVAELPAHLERALGVPVLITSHGPQAEAKRWRTT